MSRFELVRVPPPPLSWAPWDRCGTYPDPDGGTYRLEAFGVLYGPGLEHSSFKRSPEKHENYFNRFRAADPAHRAYALANFRELMEGNLHAVGWIADADRKVDFYQLRRVDRDDPTEPLPDAVGKVVPMGAARQKRRKVA